MNANAVLLSPNASGLAPINYFFSGTLNVDLWGYSVPVSLNYSNRKFSYSQPYSFNQISFNPSYKWVRAQIGTTSMNFSSQSLNGHQFTGSGLVLSPKNWNIQLMTGRLIKKQTDNPIVGPSFARMGYGFKVLRNLKQHYVGLTAFHAADNQNSLLPTELAFKGGLIAPKSNVVIGVNFKTILAKAIQLEADYHQSLLNTNTTVESKSIQKTKLLGQNTQSFGAFKSRINFNLAKTQSIFGIGFERIDPDYQTLGGYYFVNDFQNVTGQFTQSLFKSKLNLSANVGLQKDDLKQTKSSSQQRVVAAFNVNANPTEKLNISADYSNFKSVSYLRTVFDEIKKFTPFEQIDTLNFSQISQNINSNITYELNKSETKKSNLLLSVNSAIARNYQAEKEMNDGFNNFLNTNANYSASNSKINLTYNAGVNYSINKLADQDFTTYGPIVSIQKGFNKNRLTTNFSGAALRSKSIENSANIYNLRLGGVFKVNKNNVITSTNGFTITNNKRIASMSLGYNYKF